MQPRRKPKKVFKLVVIVALTVVLTATALILTSSKWLPAQHVQVYGKVSGDQDAASADGEDPGNSSNRRWDSSRAAALHHPPSGWPGGGGGDGATDLRTSSPLLGSESVKMLPSNGSRGETGAGGNNNNKNNRSRESRLPEDNKPARQRRKVIGYECTQNNCGGWADRQKGMVATYVIAALLERDFKLSVTVPCPLVSLLRPNKVDWRVERSELDGSNVQRMHIIDGDARTYFQNLQNRANLDDVFPADVTLLTSNMEAVQFLRLHPLAARVPWLHGQSVEDVYRRVLTDLFAPTPELQNVIDSVKAAVPAGKQLVCAHMRIGSDAVLNDVRQFHSHDQFSVLASFLARYNDSSHYRIVVTSDSQKIVEMTKAQFPTVSISSVAGPLAHIDKTSHGDVCDGLKRALAEQLILSTCEVLVQSESGFSKVAGFLRGRDDLLYIFRDAVLPCRRQDAYLHTDAW